MDERPPFESPNPLGAEAPTEDHVGLAVAAIAISVALGTGLSALVGFVVRTLQAGAAPADTIEFSAPPTLVLLLGTLAALLAAAITTWRLLAPTRSTYRQGALAMVSAFATLVVSVLTTRPVDERFGRLGLLVLALLSVLFAGWLGRRATRTRRA